MNSLVYLTLCDWIATEEDGSVGGPGTLRLTPYPFSEVRPLDTRTRTGSEKGTDPE